MVDWIEAWINRHDLTIDLVTVWSLAIGFALLAAVEFGTWLTMRGALDQTRVGQRLRPKKLGYTLICVAMSTLYSLSLYAYYQDHHFGAWSIFALRVLIVVGIVTASVFGVRFISALRQERASPAAPGIDAQQLRAPGDPETRRWKWFI